MRAAEGGSKLKEKKKKKKKKHSHLTSRRGKYRVPLGAGRPKLCCTVALCAEIQKLICFSSVLLPPLGILPDQHCPRYPLTNTSYCLWKLIPLCLHPNLMWQQEMLITDQFYGMAIWTTHMAFINTAYRSALIKASLTQVKKQKKRISICVLLWHQLPPQCKKKYICFIIVSPHSPCFCFSSHLELLTNIYTFPLIVIRYIKQMA